ncbi:MAG: hypothetical protein DRJ29_03520 [Bacteroidetes bacterium]|nr:MAG: hypothetical protein DRI98_00980 [Bacteroidota bacterium]RLD95199.1 MAG: hypothetical protein DRJ29_03520 [Bacteroidota bacterium]
MLHDPSHQAVPEIAREIELKQEEVDILRSLAEEWAEIASLPVHQEKAQLWQKLNDLDSERPMVWINEIPWHEMNHKEELCLRCENEWARSQEELMRRTLYQWRHMPGDMIMNPWLDCPLAIHSTDFGIIEDVDLAITDTKSDIVSRHYNIQIRNMGDLEKIQFPQVSHMQKATEIRFSLMQDLFGDILPVKKQGQTHIWFTPWDYLIRWWGIQEAMMDLILRPDMVHAFYEKMVQAWMVELDQFEKQNLLSLDCNNTRIGSGGYGHTEALPGKPFEPDWVKPYNMWGCSNAQIFSEVSPEMHWEFAIEHDLKWLERWNLNYYGCCEPIAGKGHLLKKIPNLRKVSFSPWNNTRLGIEELGDDYVISRKPSPAIFASRTFDPDQARREIREFLDQTGGNCHIELIMKDISTVMYEPQRLWEWEKICMKEVNA